MYDGAWTPCNNDFSAGQPGVETCCANERMLRQHTRRVYVPQDNYYARKLHSQTKMMYKAASVNTMQLQLL